MDVPADTAVFTHKKWAQLSNAQIICLDYSEDMIEQEKKRLKDHVHVFCVLGDAGSLPLRNDSCDIVLSMNGFHAFPNKEKAFRKHGVF